MSLRYPTGRYLRQMSAILGVDPESVLRQAELSAPAGSLDDLLVDARQTFLLWDMLMEQVDDPGAVMVLARSFATGPFIPQLYAFSCADTLAAGLRRLAEYKPLVGPLTIDLEPLPGVLRLEMRSAVPDLAVPPSMGLFQLLYITEAARTFTATHVAPIRATLPGPVQVDDNMVAHLGCRPEISDVTSMVFSAKDGARALVTRSPSFWEVLEPGFHQQMAERMDQATVSDQIRRALFEGLAGGSPTVDDLAHHLNMSKRSLQRRLREEGTSFKSMLNDTRNEMAKSYLRKSRLSLPEIAHLLGFRDASSFIRAFQRWTGTTPGNYRLAQPPELARNGRPPGLH